MPWEVTIRRRDGTPLGGPSVVREQVFAACPAFEFRRNPSGAERIEAARAAGIEFPEILRAHLEKSPASEEAVLEGDEYSITLYGFEQESIERLHVEIRGRGNPLAVLASLCSPNAWITVDDTSGEVVDLKSDSSREWKQFQDYRDQAIQDIKVGLDFGQASS